MYTPIVSFFKYFLESKDKLRVALNWIPLFLILILPVHKSLFAQNDTSSSIKQRVFILDTVQKSINLKGFIYSYFDKTQSLNIEQVANPDFQKNFTLRDTMDITQKYYWVKLAIQNKLKYSNSWYLYIYPTNNNSVYQQIGNKLLPVKQFGYEILFYKKNIILYPHFCKLHLPSDTLTVLYIRTLSPKIKGYRFAASLNNISSYSDEYRNRANEFFLLVGILVAMALYNLILFFFVRDKSYIYYSSSLIVLCIYYLSVNNVINAVVLGIASIVGINFFIAFSRHYLNAPTLFPKWNRALNIIQILYIPAILLEIPRFVFLFNGYGVLFIYVNLLFLATIIFLFSFSISALRSNYKPAKYYFISTLFFFVLISFYILQVIKNIGDTNFSALSYFTIGAIIQVILFSLALAARFNILRRELAEKQLENERIEKQKVIEIQQLTEKKNIELEHKVIERTKEIADQNKILEQQKEEIFTQTEELITVNNKLVELDKFKEMMTGMVIHDLKNPLSSIIGLSNQSYSERNMLQIKHSGKQMLNLVMNILDVQKFETTQVKLSCENTPFTEIINKSIAEISPQIEEKNIEIKITGKPQTMVNVDRGLIERVMINIVSNALKYSDNNSQIIIHTEDLANKSSIKVSITDYGQGIEPEKVSKVFDKFAQIESRKIGSLRSTGLGLAFCKMAIEAHHCEIGVESVPKQFTTFWFTLIKSQNQQNIDTIIVAITTLEKQSIPLTAEDIDYLDTFLVQISNLKYYEIGKILPLLSSINDLYSESVAQWKSELENAVFTNNEIKFDELISIKSNKDNS